MKAKQLVNLDANEFFNSGVKFSIPISNNNYYDARTNAQLFDKFVNRTGNRFYIYNDKSDISFTNQFITAFRQFVTYNTNYLQTQYRKMTSTLGNELLINDEIIYHKKGNETETHTIGEQTKTRTIDEHENRDAKTGTIEDVTDFDETNSESKSKTKSPYTDAITGTDTTTISKNETNTISPHTDIETKGITTDDNVANFINESRITRDNAQQMGTLSANNSDTLTKNETHTISQQQETETNSYTNTKDTTNTTTHNTTDTHTIGEQNETTTENEHENSIEKAFLLIDTEHNAHTVDEKHTEKTNPNFENEIEQALKLTVSDFAERFLNLFLSEYTFISNSVNRISSESEVIIEWI